MRAFELESRVPELELARRARKSKLWDVKVSLRHMPSVQTKFKMFCVVAALLRTKSHVASALKANVRNLKEKIAGMKANAVMSKKRRSNLENSLCI